ncbi:hypothetical protein [Devosia sp. MC1541]|uniref:hypothetical protein n=1 Tax=Devosia sp. MC1541 TaxID=2725264 RepID=UPI00145C6C5E|nr:hypothetical protein [Devosia sp. MC1541]
MKLFRRLMRAFRAKPQLVFSRSKKAAKALTDSDTNLKLANELASKGEYVPAYFRSAVKHG